MMIMRVFIHNKTCLVRPGDEPEVSWKYDL